jgi:hypothetical protein
MRLAFAILAVMSLVSCSAGPTNELVVATQDGPNPKLVANVEAKLSRADCLSNIATMRREYRYAWRDGVIYRDFVDIKVQEAGVDNLPAGRFIEEPYVEPKFDDRDYFAAFATYKISGDALDLWACGQNTGASIRHNPIF